MDRGEIAWEEEWKSRFWPKACRLALGPIISIGTLFLFGSVIVEGIKRLFAPFPWITNVTGPLAKKLVFYLRDQGWDARVVLCIVGGLLLEMTLLEFFIIPIKKRRDKIKFLRRMGLYEE